MYKSFENGYHCKKQLRRFHMEKKKTMKVIYKNLEKKCQGALSNDLTKPPSPITHTRAHRPPHSDHPSATPEVAELTNRPEAR